MSVIIPVKITYTSSTTDANQIIDTLSDLTVRSLKYTIQVTSGSYNQVSQILIIHDGVTARILEYGRISTGIKLATFDVSLVSGSIELLFTPVNPVTYINANRLSINV